MEAPLDTNPITPPRNKNKGIRSKYRKLEEEKGEESNKDVE